MGAELESRVEALLGRLGFELVTMERGGGRRRPLLRLRVERPGDEPGRSTVTVEDCARLARELRGWLEREGGEEGDWILEVSSPGVERPLVRPRDWERCAGRRVRVHGFAPLAGGSRRVEATLIGLTAETGVVRLEAEAGPLEVPLSAIARAELVHRWEEEES